ncbi:unnamed protein product [Arctia plantaginis]|uniref:MRN complex-interacting protein N-terminal domain-containing protein n=1 Tax=Arctia plantaginis TaxID=874455 RepID=A0A8S0ZJ66_ARCPL|nr:unnamed protein product [Arctia plantaginis]
MPQLFQVLRCYKCLTFQVHQTKKSNKWECKLCSEKQSVKRHYGIGTAKDCRLHVQKLNSMRGEIDELKCGQMQRNSQSDEEGDDKELLESIEVVSQPQPVSSKWSDYLEIPETVDEEKNESIYLGEAEVVLEIPKKRRKKLGKYCKSSINTVSATATESQSTHPEDKVLVPFSNDCTLKSMNQSNVCEVKKLYFDSLSYQASNSHCNENIPPVISKQSKWAEFIEDEDSDLKPSTIVNLSQHNHMFSLCDDSELDNVLNI